LVDKRGLLWRGRLAIGSGAFLRGLVAAGGKSAECDSQDHIVAGPEQLKRNQAPRRDITEQLH
jgi:hypothetical protein